MSIASTKLTFASGSLLQPVRNIKTNELLGYTRKLKDSRAIAYDSNKECIGRFESIAAAARGVVAWYNAIQ